MKQEKQPYWRAGFEKQWLESFGSGLETLECEEMYNFVSREIERAMGLGHHVITGQYETRLEGIYFYVKTLVRCDNAPKEEVQKITERLKERSKLIRYDWLSHQLRYVKPLKTK
jgi:hypothetical protein